MTMRDKIDGVLIDPDENGFHLILSGEEREYNFTLDQTTTLELMNAVRTEIEPWFREGLMAAAEMQPLVPDPQPYDQDDPKHPDYHDTMSGIWDNRDGK